jgi:hypothetical protein
VHSGFFGTGWQERGGIGVVALCALIVAVPLVVGACSSAPQPSQALSPGASHGPGGSAPVPAPGSTGTAATTPTEPAGPSGTPRGTGGAGGFSVSEAPVTLPEGVSRAVAFADGSSILLCGGLTATGTTGDILTIDPAGGTPTVSGRLRHAVHDAGGAALGDLRLVLGGGKTLQEAFVQGVLVGGTANEVGTLPAPRADLGAAVVGDQLVVVGGWGSGQIDPSVLATKDGTHFSEVATLPHLVRYAAVAAIGGLVLVVGGEAPGDVRWIQAVDVAAGTARVVGKLPAPLSHATALVLGGQVLVAGGRVGGRAQKSILAIDPATWAVSTVGQLPRALSDAAGVVIDGTGYLVGGEASAPLTSIIAIKPD